MVDIRLKFLNKEWFNWMRSLMKICTQFLNMPILLSMYFRNFFFPLTRLCNLQSYRARILFRFPAYSTKFFLHVIIRKFNIFSRHKYIIKIKPKWSIWTCLLSYFNTIIYYHTLHFQQLWDCWSTTFHLYFFYQLNHFLQYS